MVDQFLATTLTREIMSVRLVDASFLGELLLFLVLKLDVYNGL